MTPSLNSDPNLYAAPPAETPTASQSSHYAPSVPISVYRELATELQKTQARVEALTQQNQQLVRQNRLLRNEIQRFVQSAEQLGRFAGVAPAESPPAPVAGTPQPDAGVSPETAVAPAEKSAAVASGRVGGGSVNSAIVPQERGPQPEQTRLFTEQRDEPRRGQSLSRRSPDLGNLWLVTTILLVVVTAFGAGFLIMRPLLNR